MCPVREQHSVAVAGIVVDDSGRVLLMRRRDHGHWEPREGRWWWASRSRTACGGRWQRKRASADVGPLGGVYQNADLGVLSLVFVCAPTSNRAATTEEASDVRWVTPQEARRILNRGYAEWVTDALGDGSPPVPLQSGTVKGPSSSPHSDR